MLLTVAALVIYSEKVIVLGGLVPEQNAYDMRSNIDFGCQRSTGPPQIVTCPTARSRPLEDRLRPSIPVIEFAAVRVRKYKLLRGFPLAHRHQHRNGLARQGDNVRLGWDLLPSCSAASVLAASPGDRPQTRTKVKFVPRRRADLVQSGPGPKHQPCGRPMMPLIELRQH